MRKLFYVTALGFIITSVAFAQQNHQESIEGNGKVVTRTVAVSSFDALKASGVYELKLSQGDKESVKIEADENLQDLFQVHNEGSRLIIEMKKMEHKNLNTKNKMRVYVTFKKLKNLELSTVGNVNSESALTFDDLQVQNHSVGNINMKLTANRLSLDNTSVGNVTLSGAAQNAIVHNTGVGAIRAADFRVQSMNIENTGVGSAEVNAEKDLKVKDSFLGKVRNRGTAPMRKMNKVVI